MWLFAFLKDMPLNTFAFDFSTCTSFQVNGGFFTVVIVEYFVEDVSYSLTVEMKIIFEMTSK